VPDPNRLTAFAQNKGHALAQRRCRRGAIENGIAVQVVADLDCIAAKPASGKKVGNVKLRGAHMIGRKLNVGHFELPLIPLQHYRERVCLIEADAGSFDHSCRIPKRNEVITSLIELVPRRRAGKR
jgi:hypothetical protein